jgi:hypothetical protein
MSLSNDQTASMLAEIARLLELQGANPYRVTAYRNASVVVRHWSQPLATIFEFQGAKGLQELPGIGTSLAKRIGQMLKRGGSPLLERLRKRQQDGDLLTTLPTVGERLADRIRDTLGTSSLDELYEAAYDGRLQRVAGVGRKRVEAIRAALAARLKRSRPARRSARRNEASVGLLLDIDHEYRHQAGRRQLLTTAPRQFNPGRRAWLPILRTERHGRHFCAHFTNSARAHELARQNDWVVVYCPDKDTPGQWTIVTATHGPLRGRRVVRGREVECQRHYDQSKLLQLSLPTVVR